MNADRLIEEWRRQGRVLEVEGANTVFVADGPGRVRYLCSWGSNFWRSLSEASSGTSQPRA
jgi:hypothetical protein